MTEMITGVNLPAAQLQIAMGIPLYCIPDIRRLYGESEREVTAIPFALKPPVQPRGYVIACRITAENPDAGFQPTSGAIRELNFRSTANVWGYFSVDGSGRVHEYADSQFGHLFSWGRNRETARKNMVQALREFSIRGEIRTTIEYLLQLIQNEEYVKNVISTSWLDGLIRGNLHTAKPDACFVVLMAVACKGYVAFKQKKREFVEAVQRGQYPAPSLLCAAHHEELIYENMKYAVDVYWSGEALLTLAVNQSSTQLHIRELADGGFLINQRGQSHVVYVMERAGDLRLSVDGITCVFSQEYDPSVLRCPNSGKLARYLVQCGDHVVPGQTYAEMEVMKMYLPLVVAEAGVITRLVKAVGSVVQNGDALGYMKIDDLSKVKKAERFTSALPKEESADETAHPQFTIANALTILHSFLSGYWIAEGQARQCLDAILTATQDASLPFYEYMDVLSTMESVLPEDLKQQLNDVLFAESGAAVENKTEEQVVESVLGAEEAQPFSQQFPARRIRQVLTEYLLRSANRLQLQKEMEPLFAVTAKYRDGLLGYRASLLFELLDGFIASQRTYATLHSNSESRRSSDSYGEQVWQSEFSHQHLAAQAALMAYVLSLLAPLVTSMEEDARFAEVLQTLASLPDPDASLSELTLEARQLQLQRKLPSQEEELNELRAALKGIAAAEGQDRENAFARFIGKGGDIQQPLLAVLADRDVELSELALECYLRKVYQPYVLLAVDRCALDGFLALSFQFAAELSELPTGIRPSESALECSSEANSPCPSPPALESEDESLDMVSGVILCTHAVKEVASALSCVLAHWTASSDSVQKRVLHIILSEAPDAPCAELIARYQIILNPFKSQLEAACVSRVTVSQPSAASHSSFWDLPFSVTFRQRFDYREDALVRFVEPPLAYHLELGRLRNFNIRLVPIPNRSIHLYEATPKEPVVIRRSPLPPRRRFFVRAVCSTMDSWQTSSVTDTYPSAEKALVEALGALEMGVSEARAKGLESSVAGSHIFLNILAPTAMDPDLIEQIMKRLYQRYVKRIASLHVTQVEMRLLPVLAEGSQPIPIRMVGSDPTGMALRIDTYVETKDPFSGSVIFTSINGHITENAGEWDGHSVNTAYPVLEYLERERAYAQRTSRTLYCYDFLELIQRALLKRWKTYMKTMGVLHAVMPPSVMKVRELELVENGKGEPCELREVSRPPGRNRIGMVAWQITLFTPTYPTEGREVMVIANDITFKAGSFGTQEDLFFDLVSKRARRLGIPRVFFAANSGARIGLAEEVKEVFRVKWREAGNPQSGVDFLYLTEPDYERVKDAVKAHPVEVEGRRVYRIEAIVGRESDLGVENLAGSALIAGETSRAYNDVVTLTVVSGRSVGIGAYLVRLGQRTIQKAANAPILLTGYEALNNLMGKSVYTSNDQLGGPNIMCPNGVTHLRVDNDYEAVDAMMRWLSFVPRTRHAELLPQPLSPAVDVVDRPVTVRVSLEPYDVRRLLCGAEEDGQWQSGLFDRGSFMEVLADWARTVVTGRARLGGIPVGVIATESRTVESVTPADPAMPQSEKVVVQQAGGVWYPDSAFKTAQAIQDINQEGLPLFIVANWRGFSGGARDMFREVLKFGAYIVDQLVAFQQPVFVYIPAFAELRGGAFVVVDPHINEEVMEMYADSRARAGVLEPAGVVSIKFREGDRRKAMRRNDALLQQLAERDGENRQREKDERDAVESRQRELETAYRQVAEVFADLHDGAERMKAVGVIRQIVDVEQSRRFFYWRLRRRLLERTIEKEIMEASGMDRRTAHATLLKWFEQHSIAQTVEETADQRMLEWMTQEREGFIASQIDTLNRASIREEVKRLGAKRPDAVVEGVHAMLDALAPEDKARILASLTASHTES